MVLNHASIGRESRRRKRQSAPIGAPGVGAYCTKRLVAGWDELLKGLDIRATDGQLQMPGPAAGILGLLHTQLPSGRKLAQPPRQHFPDRRLRPLNPIQQHSSKGCRCFSSVSFPRLSEGSTSLCFAKGRRPGVQSKDHHPQACCQPPVSWMVSRFAGGPGTPGGLLGLVF